MREIKPPPPPIRAALDALPNTVQVEKDRFLSALLFLIRAYADEDLPDDMREAALIIGQDLGETMAEHGVPAEIGVDLLRFFGLEKITSAANDPDA